MAELGQLRVRREVNVAQLEKAVCIIFNLEGHYRGIGFYYVLHGKL